MVNIPEIFGCNVFNETMMKAKLIPTSLSTPIQRIGAGRTIPTRKHTLHSASIGPRPMVTAMRLEQPNHTITVCPSICWNTPTTMDRRTRQNVWSVTPATN